MIGYTNPKNHVIVDNVVTNPYTIQITNSSWQEGSHSHAEAEGNVLTVTNDFKPATQETGFEVTKVLNGLDLSANQFRFQLLDSSRNVLQTVGDAADGRVVFGKETFTLPGTYNFIIKEINDNKGGITYTDREVAVQVVVNESDSGLVIGSIKYLNDTTFTNSYSAAPTTAIIGGSKKLDGLALNANQFTFQLLNSSGSVIQTATNNADGSFSFAAINYDEVGEHTYTVREKAGTQGGITYDETDYSVVVSVHDDLDGILTATVEYLDGPVVFNNTYEAKPDGIVIEGTKTLTGQDLRNGQFKFELVDSEDNVVETVTNNALGQIIFSEITYDEIGEHTYTVREVEGVQGGVTYDTSEFEVKVTVTDNGEGQLVAKMNLVDGAIEFHNTYVAKADSVVIEGTKVLKGHDLAAGQFEFELIDEKDEVIQTVTNNVDGQIIFDEITYDEVGIYTYLVREVIGSDEDIIYDESVYKVVVTVIDDGEGNLVADALIEEAIEFENIHADSLPGTGVENNYFGILGGSLMVFGLSAIFVSKKKSRKEA